MNVHIVISRVEREAANLAFKHIIFELSGAECEATSLAKYDMIRHIGSK